MRKGITCMIIMVLLIRTNLLAQVTIRGNITDGNNLPLNKVKLFIKGAFEFTYSDARGQFILSADSGRLILVAQNPLYPDVEMPITTGADTLIRIHLNFDQKITRLQDVVVNWKNRDLSTDKLYAVNLTKWDVMTTAGANADIVSALKTLPGTQKNVGGDGLYVHGGLGYETQTFIDGMMVNKFFYSGTPGVSHRGRFPPSLFTGSYFASGAYSAMYGQALSSVVNLESTGLPETSSFDFNAGTAGIGMSLSKLVNSRFSFGCSFNYLNMAPYYSVVKQIYDFQRPPQFADGAINFRLKSQKHPANMLKFYASFGYSDLSLFKKDLDYPSIKDYYSGRNDNLYSILTYDVTTRNRWRITWGASYSASLDKDTTAGREAEVPVFLNYNKLHLPSESAELRNTWKKNVLPNVELSFGGEYQRYQKSLRQDSSYDIYHLYRSVTATDNYFGLFTEGAWRPTSRLTARLGLREDISTLLKEKKLSPRLLLNYSLSPTADLHVAYGTFYQKPDYDNTILFKHNLDFAEAVHYSAGFQKGSFDRSLFRAEIYYKDYRRLLTTTPDTSMRGYGYAKGIDLFWKSNFFQNKFEYWLSYSYIDSKRKFSYYPIYTQPDFVANNSFSVVVKRFFSKLSMHAALSYSYESGRPYYNPNRSDQGFLSDRTPAFQSLDASIAYVRTIHKLFSIFVLTVTNTLNNNQVFGYTYSAIDYSHRIAQTPLASRFIYLGAFFSLGIDRTKEVFNSNL